MLIAGRDAPFKAEADRFRDSCYQSCSLISSGARVTDEYDERSRFFGRRTDKTIISKRFTDTLSGKNMRIASHIVRNPARIKVCDDQRRDGVAADANRTIRDQGYLPGRRPLRPDAHHPEVQQQEWPTRQTVLLVRRRRGRRTHQLPRGPQDCTLGWGSQDPPT